MLGIFKSARATATEASIVAVRPIIGIIQYAHGLPARFWTDPYILGFFTFVIGHYGKLATRGDTSNTSAVLISDNPPGGEASNRNR